MVFQQIKLVAIAVVWLAFHDIAYSRQASGEAICRFYDNSSGDKAINTGSCPFQGVKYKMVYKVLGRSFSISRLSKVNQHDVFDTRFKALLNGKKALLQDHTAYSFSVVSIDKALQFEVVEELHGDAKDFYGIWTTDYPAGCKKTGGEFLEGTVVLSKDKFDSYESRCNIKGVNADSQGVTYLRVDCTAEFNDKSSDVYTIIPRGANKAIINNGTYTRCGAKRVEK